jgi:hypothetical protein
MLRYIYEQQWPELSEQFYKDGLWPPADAVMMELNHVGLDVDEDDNSLVLYKELYYRHIFYTKVAHADLLPPTQSPIVPTHTLSLLPLHLLRQASECLAGSY